MKDKFTIGNIGDIHAQLEVEDECDVSGIVPLWKQIKSELGGDRASTTPFAKTSPATKQRNTNSNPEMASEEALRALWGAAMRNGMDVENVCRGYGVDPNHISKRECWQMTQYLNERSGYRKNQQKMPSEKNGGIETSKGGGSFWD